MSLIYRLAEIIEECRAEYKQILEEIEKGKYADTFITDEIYGQNKNPENNILACGDNLEFMKFLLSGERFKGKLNMIYVDPPFFSKADYRRNVKIFMPNAEGGEVKIRQTVYTDTWQAGMEEYLKMMCLRLFLMRELLSEEGCIWVHLDWHVSHYIKVIMDEIFNIDNFINEVIWNYKSGGTGSRRFARKHDTLLFYGKTDKYFFEIQKEKSYNRGFKPYRFKGVDEFQDDIGWYTLVNMKDVWQMDMVGRTSSERTGYATQKPEALIERIMKSCTKEGDLCADFFGGSGTMAAVAEKMHRRWISCDSGKNAVVAEKKRMCEKGAAFIYYRNPDTLKETEKNCGVLEIKTGKDAESRYKITLEKYVLNEEEIKNFDISEQEKIKKALEENSLSFIDYISLDFQYDGNVHKSHVMISRKNGILENDIPIPEPSKNLHIVYADVFGNTGSRKIVLR